MSDPATSNDLNVNELFAQRQSKLAALREAGVDPFLQKFEPTLLCGEVSPQFTAGTLAEGTEVSVAGRLSSIRNMGNSIFIDVRDWSGRIQIYVQRKEIAPELLQIIESLDLGDIAGVTGTVFRTRAGEVSVRAVNVKLLSKALRPPPAKYYGLEDTEVRYRQRYLDLIANEESMKCFVNRSRILSEIRNFFAKRAYFEVETPMMQAIPGGAAAKPFVTHHNALGIPLYMRIAPELFLKRLLVGGMTRIFEIGRNFRNEGVSRRHNPEFTMLEAYQAYSDFNGMMELVEELVCHVATTVFGTLKIEHLNEDGTPFRTIDLTRPWRRAPFVELVNEKMGPEWPTDSFETKCAKLKELGVEFAATEAWELDVAVFEKFIEPTLINPTFVTHPPKWLVPLAKSFDGKTVEVFECCINGQEIAPGYTEQNDPGAQREAFETQAGEDKQKVDEDFLVALEHGMPPAGGIGMGIDRLCMMLMGKSSIRDVIFFPAMKPKDV